jgi:hypothetical protein
MLRDINIKNIKIDKILFYDGGSSCPRCAALRNRLDKAGIDYTVRNGVSANGIAELRCNDHFGLELPVIGIFFYEIRDDGSREEWKTFLGPGNFFTQQMEAKGPVIETFIQSIKLALDNKKEPK